MARLMEFEPRTWRLSTTGLTTAPMIRLCKNDSTFPLIYVRASKIAKSYAGGWVRTQDVATKKNKPYHYNCWDFKFKN
jgi:hypothetical protein